MKKKLSFALLPLFLIALMMLSSCNSNADKSKKSVSENEEPQNLEQVIEKNVYPLPASVKVINTLSDLGIGYISGITNPVENVKNYTRRASQAINLGVYGADLSYTAIFNDPKEVMNYMGSIRVLSNELGLSGLYDESLYEKIKINLDKKDSLVSMLTDVFNSTYSELSEKNQEAMTLLFVGGAWLEGMYLTTRISEAAYHISGVSGVMLDQKKSFEMLLKLCEPYENDMDVKELVQTLQPVKTVYSGIGTSLSKQNIADITKAIDEIRSKAIVQ